MSSARDLNGIGVFAQGAGRVDLTRAIKQTVTASPSALNLGLQSYPHDDDKPVTQPVTYRNDGATPVRLMLALRGGKDTAQVFTLSRSVVDIPAHGTATIDVTADTSKPVADGAYAGWLVATGNGMETRTTVGVGKEIPSYGRKVTVLDRDGKPVTNDENQFAAVFLLDVDHQQAYMAEAGETLKLPRGRYVMDGLYGKVNPGGFGYGDATYFGEPDLVIDGEGELVLDARTAHKIAVQAPVPGADPASGAVGFTRPIGDETFVGGIAITNSFQPGFSPDLYVAQNKTGTAKNFTGFAHLAWAEIPPDQSPDNGFYLDSPYLYHDVVAWPGRFPANPELKTKKYAHLDASYAGEPGTRANNYGFPTLPRKDKGGHVVGLFLFTPAVEMNLPFRRQEYYSADGINWGFETDVFKLLPENEVEYTSIVDSQHVAYPAGRTTPIRWQQGVFGPSLADNRAGLPGKNPVPWVFRDGDSLTVVALMHADGGAGRYGDSLTDSERTTLARDGVELAASDAFKQQTFALPADEAKYTLTKEVKRSPKRFRLSTEITSEWTFRSARTPDGESSALPLMTVRYAPVLDERNRAAAGRFAVPVTVEHQYGADVARVVSLEIEASLDEKTWQRLPVRRTGSGWTATIDQPGSGFVSLRARAKDAAGNEVKQTILRAYELK
ncbi:hypothetical protein EV643_102339 [Kribbella sp. VKM Ac-2527]|uniref:Uncharacterized protein n=1 Tax=Kribbella caucasensis TaxID=2512215 RepID=A0A4R6KQ69_9ACTN|nr:hypothetical protein [Kribbella sp. VKM Ac-2527]TDO52500.1 hypothetical protein EV643_102339 [Kribbella sp. VKM Ac-2527]